MGILRGTSLGTHLLIAAGLLIGVVAVAVGSNWSTFAVMYENLAAMNEGQRVAEQMRQPSDLLKYISAHPNKVSLVAYEVGARDEGIFFGADQRRAVVQVPSLLLLAEYSQRLEDGGLTPSDRVPLDSIGMYALPGAGKARHERALAQWKEDDQVFADSTVSLAQIVQAMVEFGDPAATDWLITRLGRETVHDLPGRWGLPSSDPLLPRSGLYLTWMANEGRNGSDAQPASVRVRSPTDRTDQVYRHVQTVRRDSSYRQTVRARLEQQGLGLSVRDQKRLAHDTYPSGTARDYADLMARIVDGTLGGGGTAWKMWEHLESNIPPDTIEAPITGLATQVGAMPGLISFVGAAQRPSNQSARVSALLFEDLPIGLFYHIVQTDLDKGLQLRLLSDSEFFETARTLLSADTTSTSP